MSTLTKAQIQYKLDEANDIISNQKVFLKEKEAEIEELKSKNKLLEDHIESLPQLQETPKSSFDISDLENKIESFTLIAEFLFGKNDCKREVRRFFKIIKEYIDTPKEGRNRFITLTLMNV
jgi:hypothetical protein